MLQMRGDGLRETERGQRVNTNNSGRGWSFAPLPKGYQLVGLIAATLLMMFVTVTIGDSAFSNWGVEANSGWQLISSGHSTTRVLAGARTDQSSGSAFIRGGHILVVDYNVSVEDGSAFLNVYNSFNLSDDALFYESIEHDQQRHLEIPVTKTGLYYVDMSYYSFRGTIDVRWHVD